LAEIAFDQSLLVIEDDDPRRRRVEDHFESCARALHSGVTDAASVSVELVDARTARSSPEATIGSDDDDRTT